jgi:hypothetical protein
MHTFTAVEPRWWLSNFGGMVVYGVVASRSRSRLLRAGFAAAVGLHVGEAVYAYRRAQRAGFGESAPRWAVQTLGVGFPSLLALRALIDERAHDPAPATR